METMDRPTNGRWKTFRKRTRNVFRRTNGTESAAMRSGATSTSTSTRTSKSVTDDRDDGRTDDRDDGRTDEGRTDDGQLHEARALYAEARRVSERLGADLCDAVHENRRLKDATRVLLERQCETADKTSELMAERTARRVIDGERAANADRLTAENRVLNAMLCESARRTGSAERRADAAERRADVTEERADRMADAWPTLSSAVDDMRRVLSSTVFDLRADVLRRIVDKLLYVIEATTADDDDAE